MSARLFVRLRFGHVTRSLLLAAVCLAVCLTLPALALALMSAGDGGWQWLDPQPQGNDLQAVVDLGAQHAIAAGDNATLLGTSDGGATWAQQALGPSGGHFSALDFVDAQDGFAWPSSQLGGGVLHTTDGGVTWTPEYGWPGGPAVDFVDADHGWVGAGSVSSTADGGAHWSTHACRSASLWRRSRLPIRYGWGVGNVTTGDPDDPQGQETFPAVVVTSDGGVTWQTQPLPSALATNEGGGLGSVRFVDANTGWAAGIGVLHTTDGGATWTQQTPDRTSDILGPIEALDADHAWVPDSTSVLTTTDGGATWTARSVGFAVNAVSFRDLDDGYAVGDDGGIATTSDGGVTWQVRSAVTPAGGLPVMGPSPSPTHCTASPPAGVRSLRRATAAPVGVPPHSEASQMP